jgi:monoamine oxidase
MAHSLLFDHVRRSLRLALLPGEANRSCEDRSVQASLRRPARREVIAGTAGALLAAGRAFAAPPAPNINVGIVGAGLAGLACGWQLHRRGVAVTLYDAESRVGGRCFSLGGAFNGPVNFPGQVVERGGELNDNCTRRCSPTPSGSGSLART